MITIEPLTLSDVEYIFANMRDYDKTEARLQGLNENNLGRALECTHTFVGKHHGVPGAMFGANVIGHAVWLWFLATDEAEHHWKYIHASAKGFIDWVEAKYWGHPICVQVWAEHRKSIAWLHHLGFEFANYGWGKDGERMLMTEKK